MNPNRPKAFQTETEEKHNYCLSTKVSKDQVVFDYRINKKINKQTKD
jgi:hypothetical protein